MVFSAIVRKLSILIAASATTLLADPADLKDLDQTVLRGLAAKAKETVSVTLDGSLLKFAAKFLSDSDDEGAAHVKKLIASLKSVTVRSFEFKKKGDYTAGDVDGIRNQLRTPDWNRIVDINNKEEAKNVEIYVLPGKDKPQGLIIIDTEPLELTLVHIMGAIDLKDLASLEDLGVPALGGKDGAKTKENNK